MLDYGKKMRSHIPQRINLSIQNCIQPKSHISFVIYIPESNVQEMKTLQKVIFETKYKVMGS